MGLIALVKKKLLLWKLNRLSKQSLRWQSITADDPLYKEKGRALINITKEVIQLTRRVGYVAHNYKTRNSVKLSLLAKNIDEWRTRHRQLIRVNQTKYIDPTTLHCLYTKSKSVTLDDFVLVGDELNPLDITIELVTDWAYDMLEAIDGLNEIDRRRIELTYMGYFRDVLVLLLAYNEISI